MAIADTLLLVGTPETNKVMAGELKRLATRKLGLRLPAPAKRGTGTLVYDFAAELAHLAVNYHRTSTRALWGLYDSHAPRLEPLYEELRGDVAGDDRQWYWAGAKLSVRARNVAGFAAGERQIVGTVKNAIIDGAADRGIELSVDADAADLLVTVRMHDDQLMIGLDLAGRSLSQRGYRLQQGMAPLREHLAAVLLMLARYDARSEVLLDPMCGSGTIAIEAALMATAAPLWGEARPPAMAAMPVFAELDAVPTPLFADAVPRVVANDIDAKLISSARGNAGRAGVVDTVRFCTGDFRDLDRKRVVELAGTDEGGVIVCNPPYGERVGSDLPELYRSLQQWCRQFRGWRAAFIVGNREFEAVFGRPRIRKPLANGPIRSYFYLYDL
jgi:23S rRNA G2445 N2-methylase RlmL